ncbi:probable inactive poly [ADP-ribose] polymerase SRO2 [Papaver somniferum]|uniref:probable inactive poly [ADP-ribose] polymerase SRO2 n=1 Tax=Papaver somniferum TaxID=3469 RepID=UPI000E6F6E8E|nr:probable inactive poly [ADP-ribose] polymerase SRO2 [Papaver somniferum]
MNPNSVFNSLSGEQVLSESDCESTITSENSTITTSSANFFNSDDLILLDETDSEFLAIKKKFLSNLGALANSVNDFTIHKNSFQSFMGQVKIQSFKLFSLATAKKKNPSSSSGNVQYAWFGSTKHGVEQIISHGFSQFDCSDDPDKKYGSGVYLLPEKYPLGSVALANRKDENGFKHVVLCRVVLGNMEEIRSGSQQFCPSSVEFDSGADNLLCPKKYIVWSTSMNFQILPEYVVSFKAPDSLDVPASAAARPTSPWMSFTSLIRELSKHLTPLQMALIKKQYKDFKERKITRQDMIQVVRRTAGDGMLSGAIKSFYRGMDRANCATVHPSRNIIFSK